jgi:hypothetical protein
MMYEKDPASEEAGYNKLSTAMATGWPELL